MEPREQPVSTVPPIRREILVDADPDTAFEVFTAGLGQWWPLAEDACWPRRSARSTRDARAKPARSICCATVTR